MQRHGLRERKMRYRHITLIAVVAISSLILAACGSDSVDVATLRTAQDTQAETPNADADLILDDEAKMMAFTECLRDQGIEVMDPVVDADGNIQKPEFADSVGAKGDDFSAAWEACAEHLEGFTFERKRVDASEQVDRYVALAACLRDKGYDIDDPTAATLDEWERSFKEAISWDDPADVADYEECSGETLGGNGGK
jgi:hypothetical protein